MTYTIIGRCERTGQLGVGLATYSYAVGGYCPFIRSGVGAVSSQAFANPTIGHRMLDLIEDGLPLPEMDSKLRGLDRDIDFRQVGGVTAAGDAFAFTGPKTRRWSGHRTGQGYVAMGNVLPGQGVLESMEKAFKSDPSKPLVERLLAALEAGREAGGQRTEAGKPLNERSASVLIYGNAEYPVLDLRVDVHQEALAELRRAYAEYSLYLPLYEWRARDPSTCPPQDEWAARVTRNPIPVSPHRGHELPVDGRPGDDDRR